MLNRSTGHVMKQSGCKFDSMSTSELWDFYNELGVKLTAELEAEATLLQRRLDEIQRRASAQPVRGRGRRKQTVMAKFRNPHPPFQTWSGRGTRPRWVKEVLDDGRTMDSLRIDAPVSPPVLARSRLS